MRLLHAIIDLLSEGGGGGVCVDVDVKITMFGGCFDDQFRVFIILKHKIASRVIVLPTLSSTPNFFKWYQYRSGAME